MASQVERGTIEYEDGKTYTGEIVNGRAQGEAVVKYADGRVYTGAWENEAPNGRGKMEYTNGTVYEGDWKDGEGNGQGKCTLSCGNSYEGEFKAGKFHGNGKLKLGDRSNLNGFEYSGDWVEGKMSGQGTVKYSNGDEFNGQFKDGKKHGQGTCKYANGNTFTGEWVDHQRHGTGTCVEASTGHVYKAVYNNGMPLFIERTSPPIDAGHVDRPRTDEGAGAFKPDEYDATCTICYEKFTFDTNAADGESRRRLPVLGWMCAHCVCHGCVLDQQLASAKADKPLPRWIRCMHCREENAFCPSEPKYNTELIDALSRLASAEEG